MNNKTYKTLLATFCLLILQNIYAQELPIDIETQKITFSEVVSQDGVSKEELYLRAAEYSKKNTKIEDNKTDAKYVSKIVMKLKYPAPMRGFFHDGEVSCRLSIACKEGKYKYEITDFVHSSDRGSGGKLENKLPDCGKFTLTPEGWASIKKQVQTEINKQIDLLKAGMVKMSPSMRAKNKDNW